MEQDDPTLDQLRLLRMRREREKAKATRGVMTPEAIAMRVGNAVNPIAAAKAAPYALASFVGNIGETAAKMWSPYTGNASPLVQHFDQLSQSSNKRIGEIAEAPGRGNRGGALVGSLIGGAAPYVASGIGLPLGAAAGVSAALTGMQAGAGRDASTVGMLADMTDDEGGTAVFEKVANNPFARVAADVGLDAVFSGIGPAWRAMRGTGRAASAVPPQAAQAALPAGQYNMDAGNVTRPMRQLPPGSPPRVSPETDASRLLEASSRTTQGPSQTAPLASRGRVPRPDDGLDATARLEAAAAQAPGEPEGLVTPTPKKPSRSRQKQTALIGSVKRTAAQLEHERMLNRRATEARAGVGSLATEDTEASAALAGAAGFARNAETMRSPILDQFGNRAGVGALEAMNTLTGMGIGAGIGGTQGDTPQERMRNAGLGAVLGGGAMAGATVLGRRALDMALDGVRKTSGELPTRMPRPRMTPDDIEFDDMMRTPMGPHPLDPLMDPQNSATAISMRRTGATPRVPVASQISSTPLDAAFQRESPAPASAPRVPTIDERLQAMKEGTYQPTQPRRDPEQVARAAVDELVEKSVDRRKARGRRVLRPSYDAERDIHDLGLDDAARLYRTLAGAQDYLDEARMLRDEFDELATKALAEDEAAGGGTAYEDLRNSTRNHPRVTSWLEAERVLREHINEYGVDVLRDRAMQLGDEPIGGATNRRGAIDLNAGQEPRLKNRRGAIDLSTLFDWGNQREQPLLSRHDTHPSRITGQLHAGGFPAPSIGISPADAPSPGFGNASVLFKSAVTDPSSTDVFKGDAYTPRAPSESDIRMRPVLDFLDEVRSGKGEFSVDEVYGGPSTSGTPPLKELLSLVHGTGANASTATFGSASPRLNERLRQVLMEALDKDWNPDDALALMKRSHPGDWRGRELMMTTDDSGDLLDVLGAAKVTSPKSLRTIVTRPVQSVAEMREWANRNVPRVATSSNVSDMYDQLTQQHQNMTSRWYRAIQRVANNAIARPGGKALDDGLIGEAVARAEALFQRGDITKQDIPEYMYRLTHNDGGGPDWADAPPSVRAGYEALAHEADRALEAPTKYLEAKPKRILTPDDVAGIIVPEARNQGINELLAAAKMRGVPVHSYTGMPRFGPDMATEDIRQAVVGANKFEALGRNPYGFANPQALSTVAGAGGGAMVGGTMGDTPEERARNAVTLGLAGAGVGAGLGSALKNVKAKPGAPKPPRTAYARGIANGTLGTPKPDPKMVPSLGRDAIPGEGVRRPRVKVTDPEVAALAKALDTDAIVEDRVVHMDPTQLKAVGQRIVDLRREAETLADELGRATPETVDAIGDKMNEVMDELLKYDEAFNAAASSQGRALRLVGKVVAGKGTLESAVGAARQLLGVKQLSPSIMDQLRGVMLNPAFKSGAEREAAMVQVLRQAQKLPWWRVVLDARRVGLLTSPVTWMVNTTGNVAEAVNRNFIVTPTAAAFDAVFSAATGKKRVVGMAGRGSGLASGAKRGGKTVQRRVGQLMSGQRPDVADFTEQGFDSLRRNQVDYVRDVGDTIGKRPAQAAQAVSDIVFTAMDAADQPFYQAALDAAYAERAHLHAKNAGLKPGSRQYDDAVRTMLERDPDTGRLPNMSKADEIGAIWDALDDTFKTDVPITKALNTFGPVTQGLASWVIPFIKTPTNLIRKAFEATPGLGFAVTEAHLRGLKKKFAQAGIPEHIVADEVRRARTLSGAKQFSTGLGLVMAGFALTQAGMLSGEYIPPMGRTDEDTAEARRKAVMNTPPLSITIDGKAHSLSAFAQFAPLLAFGHAIAEAVDRERKAGENVVADVLSRTALASARTIAEFPMLQGMKNVADLFSGEKAGDFGTYAGREAATLVPGSAAVATLSRLTDPIAKRQPEGFTQAIMDRLPGLREQLPAKVGPMGEVTPRMDALSTLFAPTRPQRTNTGPLYDALDQMQFYPTAAPRGENESYADYSARRQQEGPNERALLESVMAGNPEGWSYVGGAARDSLDATGDFSYVMKSALARQRTMVSRERQSRRPVP